MLRVFFLGTVGPEHAKAYLEREATVHEDLEALLQTIERDTDWDTSDFNRYGQLVIESGRRYAHGQAHWAHWAANQVDNLEANETPAQPASQHGENLAHLMDAIIATGSVSGELLGELSPELRSQFAADGPVQLFTPWLTM